MSLCVAYFFIDSSLNRISIYYMSLFIFYNFFVDTLDKIQKMFFCQGASSVRNYYMIKRKYICR
jgi:hypothetical protein